MTLAEKWAWAAGIFEGEGWMSRQSRKNGRFAPIIGIQMSDKDVLERFQAIVGVGNIYYRKARIYSYEKINSRKEQWAWRLSKRDDIVKIIEAFLPWFGNRRFEKAKEILQLAKNVYDKPGIQTGYKHNRPYNFRHGSMRRYRQGCMCEACQEANRLRSTAAKPKSGEILLNQ